MQSEFGFPTGHWEYQLILSKYLKPRRPASYKLGFNSCTREMFVLTAGIGQPTVCEAKVPKDS